MGELNLEEKQAEIYEKIMKKRVPLLTHRAYPQTIEKHAEQIHKNLPEINEYNKDKIFEELLGKNKEKKLEQYYKKRGHKLNNRQLFNTFVITSAATILVGGYMLAQYLT